MFDFNDFMTDYRATYCDERDLLIRSLESDSLAQLLETVCHLPETSDTLFISAVAHNECYRRATIH